MPSRTLIYPAWDSPVTESQFAAVADAAATVGDRGFYIELLTLDADTRAWRRTFEDHRAYDEFTNRVNLMENAMFSPSGKWGIVFSFDKHAVVGATPPFLETLRNEFRVLYGTDRFGEYEERPLVDEDVLGFIDLCRWLRPPERATWSLPELLAQCTGLARAGELLAGT